MYIILSEYTVSSQYMVNSKCIVLSMNSILCPGCMSEISGGSVPKVSVRMSAALKG